MSSTTPISTENPGPLKLLEFDLGQASYGINLIEVREVISQPETTPIPNSQEFFVGIMNLRGQIISVIDLRKKLNIISKSNLSEEAVIIVNTEKSSIGLVVDSINKVINYNSTEMSEAPEVQNIVTASYIQGVLKKDTKITIILKLDVLLDFDDPKHELQESS